MGQICSFCRWLCCCCVRGDYKTHRQQSEFDCDFESSVRDIDNYTKHYKLPSEEFKNEEEIFRERGYDWRSMELIGKGGFSTVFQIKTIDVQRTLAVKVIDFKKKGDDEKKSPMKKLEYEIRCLKRVNHRNIVRLEDDFVVNTSCYIFMEWANGKTVEAELDDSGPFTESKAQQYFLHMVRGVQYIHNQKPPIAHSDLKLDNILIFKRDNQKILKITDFGLSKEITLHSKKQRLFRLTKPEGSLNYMAPEMLKLHIFHNVTTNRRDYKRDPIFKTKDVNPIKTDIWSLGVCNYRMVANNYPFEFDPYHTNQDASSNVKVIADAIRDQHAKKWKPITASNQLMDLLSAMLEANTRTRIDIKTVVDHQWLNGVNDVIPDESSSQ